MENKDIIIAKNIGYLPMFLIGISMESYIILLVFMLVDTFTGVTKVYFLKGGHSIRSRELSRGILNKFLVIIIPLVLVWAGRGAGLDLLFLAKGVLGVFILSEAYSIIGNIQSIRTGKEKSEFDAVSYVITHSRDYLEKVIKILFEKIK